MWYIILMVILVVGFLVYRNINGKEKTSSPFSNESKSLPVKDTKRKIDDQYNLQKKQKEKEIDKILDKINNFGIGSLSKKEKELLENNSKGHK